MTFRPLPFALLFLSSVLAAWSPRFHEVQTELATGLIPRNMAEIRSDKNSGGEYLAI